MRPTFFCVFLLLRFGLSMEESCGNWIKEDDETTYKNLLQSLNDRAQVPIKAYLAAVLTALRCVEEFIRRNFEKSGGLLMETFPATDFDEAANAAILNVRNSIDKWSNILHSRKQGEKKTKKVQLVAPAFQWAQSLSHVYLNVKYSAKLDSPGYLEVANETVNFTSQGLALVADVERVQSFQNSNPV